MPRGRPASPRVLVVGGGHAGVEAAAAAARLGLPVLLATHSLDSIGQMSCNPAIGGIGKSHLVREIDALDGVMAKAADRAGIHYRILNTRKGPAVRATRAQADRSLYRTAVRQLVEAEPLIELVQDEVEELVVKNNKVAGARLKAAGLVSCAALVLTAGTFLAGVMHTGKSSAAGGRAGHAPATRLAACLRELNLPVGRLKTGTPPRLDGRSIDYGRLESQPTARPLPSFCLLGPPPRRPRQVACHLTATNERSHAIVRRHLKDSPVYSGAISGAGPRYCPSIEDKVTRFADRDAHRIFLEPEGLHTAEVYPNGISTALPAAAQEALVRSIAGLEEARLTRLGYAVEYDYYDPRALDPSLAVRQIEGLYFAGQINGTTGYEEAAAQGLVAGANAALRLAGREAWVPGRAESYLGVLVDDLTAQGVTEPYRMFTSRAEHRLSLREDNADLRLTAQGAELGLVSEERRDAALRHQEEVEAEMARLAKVTVPAAGSRPPQPALKWLARPQARYGRLPGRAKLSRRAAAEIEARCKYGPLIERQRHSLQRERELEDLILPADLDFAGVHGLSNEAREKLRLHRPATLGQAARLSGLTPAAVSLLRLHLDRRRRA
ncbi:MAG: tRNA uridine-5-carboxymethylaminomethyl(34) synthesis enzyme MnmG [Betaproteobacteria bacterium AqS2]|uniref:tRNA uridine 5-carboxymethylaminomethyl modification enzyme MnmG n=1 Tax=Candidatus Amphirhobacter heronislandensis TaxID=1732024 RepID=A0A930UDF2_9GAMM|nr:tRNA uridine-5-carboxymethylaminomethyl(34) synthesis enzyme MnmG [Betaproteobacteria bacterium AqS2]